MSKSWQLPVCFAVSVTVNLFLWPGFQGTLLAGFSGTFTRPKPAISRFRFVKPPPKPKPKKQRRFVTVPPTKTPEKEIPETDLIGRAGMKARDRSQDEAKPLGDPLIEGRADRSVAILGRPIRAGTPGPPKERLPLPQPEPARPTPPESERRTPETKSARRPPLPPPVPKIPEGPGPQIRKVEPSPGRPQPPTTAKAPSPPGREARTKPASPKPSEKSGQAASKIADVKARREVTRSGLFGAPSFSVKPDVYAPYYQQVREKIEPLVGYFYMHNPVGSVLGPWANAPDRLIVDFHIVRSGAIVEIQIVRAAKDRAFTSSCVRALKKASLDPFPKYITEKALPIRYDFNIVEGEMP